MILNATSEDRVAFLHRFWIATISQRSNLFKTKIFITGGPLGAGGPGQLTPFLPLNPDLGSTSEKFRGGKVIFGNDYDVIDVHSNLMRLFCYDQLTNIGGGTFFIMGVHGRP